MPTFESNLDIVLPVAFAEGAKHPHYVSKGRHIADAVAFLFAGILEAGVASSHTVEWIRRLSLLEPCAGPKSDAFPLGGVSTIQSCHSDRMSAGMEAKLPTPDFHDHYQRGYFPLFPVESTIRQYMHAQELREVPRLTLKSVGTFSTPTRSFSKSRAGLRSATCRKRSPRA